MLLNHLNQLNNKIWNENTFSNYLVSPVQQTQNTMTWEELNNVTDYFLEQDEAIKKRTGSLLAVMLFPDEAMEEVADMIVFWRDFYHADADEEAIAEAKWNKLFADNDDKMSRLAEKIREENRSGKTIDLDINEL